jgi:hypothetical protein
LGRNDIHGLEQLAYHNDEVLEGMRRPTNDFLSISELLCPLSLQLFENLDVSALTQIQARARPVGPAAGSALLVANLGQAKLRASRIPK